jgi:uncharacterized protein (DUF4415 family)
MSNVIDSKREAGQAAFASQDDTARAEARRQKAQQAIMPTPEEDAEITAAALSDPDSQPIGEGEMANFKPARRPRGRPVQEITKVPTTMRLDSDIVDSFKATGAGWQTRVNGALRLFLASNNLLMQRYYATIYSRGTEAEQLGEYLVMALNDDQAREKVKSFLQASGDAEAARGEVFTVGVEHARLATDVPVIY